MFAKADGPACVMPTFTMKWLAAARPKTLLRSAMGRTSAPYSQVVLLSMLSTRRSCKFHVKRVDWNSQKVITER